MITHETLKAFCSTDDTRPQLQRIMHSGTHAYATDGHVLVRIESDLPATEGDEKLIGNMETLIANAHPAVESEEWVSEIPNVEPLTKPCETCDGTGKTQECPSCDGEGEVTLTHDWMDKAKKWHHDDYDCDCQHCDGSGRIGGEGDECEECDGTGMVTMHTHVALVGSWFGAALLNRVRDLPGMQIHRHPKNIKMSGHPIRGTGWVGVLMPLRAPEECR